MSPSNEVPFADLASVDLVVDRVYRGGTAGNAGDDAISRLVPGVGNQGGFRYQGSVDGDSVRVLVLYTSGLDTDWPDAIDPVTGDFTYYGDNKKAGSRLHDTPRKGNRLLQAMFAKARQGPAERATVPPILLFESAGRGRDVIFRGLLAPGSPRLTAEEELVAVWRTTREIRFQNYRSHFTILNVPVVTREWLAQVQGGDPLSAPAPKAWQRWVRGRVYDALEAPRTLRIRSKAEQYPTNNGGLELLQEIHRHFSERPVLFEHFAAAMWIQADANVASVDVTRPSRDGGRDGVGQYLVGPRYDPVRIEFALEAKCYAPGNSVGVKDMSRLISRLKHRDFGVMVTTGHVADQVYREVREDAHPIVILAGRDIVEILAKMGLRTLEEVRGYLSAEHAIPDDFLAASETRYPTVSVELVGDSEEPRHLTPTAPPAPESAQGQECPPDAPAPHRSSQ